MSENKTFTDGERSLLWGLQDTSKEMLDKAMVPYCYNPENNCAVVLFDSRRRISSVNKIYPVKLQIIRSKKAITSFLLMNKAVKKEQMPTFFKSLVYGFGLNWQRLTGESFASVELARIIADNSLKIKTLKDLNNYVLKERPDLFNELRSHYAYFVKILSDFQSTDYQKEIAQSLAVIAQYAPTNNYSYTQSDEYDDSGSVW